MADKTMQWDDVKDAYETNRISVSGGDDFIEIYDNALPRETCDTLVRLFEAYDAEGRCGPGVTSSLPDKTLKDSTDLAIGLEFLQDPSNAEFTSFLTGPVTTCLADHLVKYMLKYHSLLPMVFETADGRFVTHGEMLDDPAMAMQVMQSKLAVLSMQIQRYKPPSQGYHGWHHESSNVKTMDRVLFPILYLNDVDEGGETEFYYWDSVVKPKAGRLLIAPGGFTHTHRMKVFPLSNAKYILTTWYTMQH